MVWRASKTSCLRIMASTAASARGGECRDHPTGVAGRWGSGDDMRDRPSPELGLDLVLDPTKGRKTGVDSE